MGDAERLERWGGSFIRYHYEPYSSGRRRDPRFHAGDASRWPSIELPAVCAPADRRFWVPHETGHILMRACLSHLQRGPHISDQQRHLVKVNDRKDESVADQFMLAWLLPPRVFREIEDLRVIATRADLPLELVQRRADLAITDFELREPPEWCAAQVYRVHRAAEPESFHLLFPGCESPAFVIPIDARRPRHCEMRLKADLVACTPPEFGRRYRKFIALGNPPWQPSYGQPLQIELPELEKWVIETRPSRATAQQQKETAARA